LVLLQDQTCPYRPHAGSTLSGCCHRRCAPGAEACSSPASEHAFKEQDRSGRTLPTRHTSTMVVVAATAFRLLRLLAGGRPSGCWHLMPAAGGKENRLSRYAAQAPTVMVLERFDSAASLLLVCQFCAVLIVLVEVPGPPSVSFSTRRLNELQRSFVRHRPDHGRATPA